MKFSYKIKKKKQSNQWSKKIIQIRFDKNFLFKWSFAILLNILLVLHYESSRKVTIKQLT